ncbi:hypothetical protein SB581_12145 [Acinetobacter baumannii]|nr:hypothetical protein SB581_12145 [Acinetobacter baumannii]
MRTFDEWFDQYENKNEYAAKQIALDGYQQGLKYRQTEVDELQKRLEFLEMNLRFVKEHFEMNDLDKAMPRVYEKLEQALKGGGE